MKCRSLSAVLAACAASALALLVPQASSAAGPAAAQLPEDDPMAVLATAHGFLELKNDARLSALYAALNAAGYSAGERLAEAPFPRTALSPHRQKVRRTAVLTEALGQRFERLFGQSPLPLSAYEACALSLGRDFSLPDALQARCSDGLSELPELLRSFWTAQPPELAGEISSGAALVRSAFHPRLDALDRVEEALGGFLGIHWDAAPHGTAPAMLLAEPLSAELPHPLAATSDGQAAAASGLTAQNRLPDESAALFQAARALSSVLADAACTGAAAAASAPSAKSAKSGPKANAKAPSQSARPLPKREDFLSALALRALADAGISAPPLDALFRDPDERREAERALKLLAAPSAPQERCELLRAASGRQ